jgi:hypothetical protein
MQLHSGRSPRRASTGGIPSSSAPRRRDPPDVSPTSTPLRSRRRVSFAGGTTDATARGSGLDVFDFSIEEERPNQDFPGGDRTGLDPVGALQGRERPDLESHGALQGGGDSEVLRTPDRKGVSGVCAESTPGVSGGKVSHVATPRSELFLPAYKRRRQRRGKNGKDGTLSTGELLEVGKRGEDKNLRAGRQAILWPELCPVRYDLARTISASAGMTSLREAGNGAGLDVYGTSSRLFSEAIPLEEQGPFAGDGIHRSGKENAFYLRARALEGDSLGASSGMERSTTEAGTSGRGQFSSRGYQSAGYGHGGKDEQFLGRGYRNGDHGRWGGNEQQRTSPRQSGGGSLHDESREDWQGVAKAWAADDAKWRSRAPLSAWPYWVYR